MTQSASQITGPAAAAPVDPSAAGPRRIGETLIDSGLITRDDLDRALAAQRREGGTLGRHLIIQEAVSRQDLYRELARQWNAPLVDLVREPPLATVLMARGEPRDFATAGWIPWRVEGDTLTIATSVPPTARVLEAARRLSGAARIAVRTATDWDIMRAVQDVGRDKLLYRITDHMAETNPAASARAGVFRWQKAVPVVIVLATLAVLVAFPRWTLFGFFVAANLLFANNILFKVLYGLRSPVRTWQKRQLADAVRRERQRRGLPADWPDRVSDKDLPVYTIFVPVYDEVEVVHKLIDHLDKLDYPKSKLDVMILLEAKDTRTIEAAKASRPPGYVRIVVVPEGKPQTKPRACNYGLEFARGEYCVIFDAEDRPSPDQLRTAVDAFRFNALVRRHVNPAEPRLVCVQAALTYFNSDYNLLTRMFAIEYAHWFEMMLGGMDDSGLPLPLGGTSNHFHTETLRRLGAWDPYNVTEDADLGLRIASQGYAVGVIDSFTEEEAASETFAWIRQRTRWIKGYMITAAVNTRHPIRWYRLNGVGGLISMGGLVLGTPVAFMAYPVALLFTLITYIGIRTGLHFPVPALAASLLLMLIGTTAMVLFSGIAAWHRYHWRIAIFAVLEPIYWLMHGAAAWRAAYQLIFDPYTWEKTPHGLTGDYDSAVANEEYAQSVGSWPPA